MWIYCFLVSFDLITFYYSNIQSNEIRQNSETQTTLSLTKGLYTYDFINDQGFFPFIKDLYSVDMKQKKFIIITIQSLIKTKTCTSKNLNSFCYNFRFFSPYISIIGIRSNLNTCNQFNTTNMVVDSVKCQVIMRS